MKYLQVFLLMTGFCLNALAQDSTNTITQHGITWTFEDRHAYGRFINGDYWVVGPVTITDINPRSVMTGGRTINGSMLNPQINWSQGYDNWMLGRENGGWNSSLNAGRPNGSDISVSNPLVISTGSLVSSISYPDLRDSKNTRVMAVLTVLDAAPPADAFRPPYVGNDKSIRHTFSDVNASLLPAVELPPQNPSYSLETAAILQLLEKPWVEHMLNYEKENFCAPDNMPAYGRDIANVIGNAACQLMLDMDQSDKRLLLIRMLQIGLDNYGILQVPNGRITWEADGGHMCGRAFPILLAGYLLGDTAMFGVMAKSGAYAYQDGHYAGNLPSDYIHFGEQDQTFYVTQQAVDITNNASVFVWAPDNRSVPIPFTVDDIGKPMWGVRHASSPGEDNNNPHHIYLEVNLPAWPGHILASLMLGIKNAWNNNALFDYVDDFVVRAMASPEYNSRGFYDNFIKAMWIEYRNDYTVSEYHGSNTHTNQEELLQIFPNPFNPFTVIFIAAPAADLRIYDMNGRIVFIDTKQSNHAHSARWDASGNPSGIYIVRAVVNGKTLSKRITLMK